MELGVFVRIGLVLKFIARGKDSGRFSEVSSQFLSDIVVKNLKKGSPHCGGYLLIRTLRVTIFLEIF